MHTKVTAHTKVINVLSLTEPTAAIINQRKTN